MQRLRLVWRLARILVHLLIGLVICALVFPWAALARRTSITQRWSRHLLGICQVQVEQGPGVAMLSHALIVANHISWLDIFVINALYPCRFVAKDEIRQWPLLGRLARAAGTIFIARGKRRALRQIFQGLVQVLAQGERVAFFPEGTVAAQGTVLPFHANLFEAAIEAQVALQPCALAYLDQAGNWHPTVDYTGDVSFGASLLAVLSGAPVRARLSCLAPIATSAAQRRVLAQAAHDAIAGALGIDQRATDSAAQVD